MKDFIVKVVVQFFKNLWKRLFQREKNIETGQAQQLKKKRTRFSFWIGLFRGAKGVGFTLDTVSEGAGNKTDQENPTED